MNNQKSILKTILSMIVGLISIAVIGTTLGIASLYATLLMAEIALIYGVQTAYIITAGALVLLIALIAGIIIKR